MNALLNSYLHRVGRRRHLNRENSNVFLHSVRRAKLRELKRMQQKTQSSAQFIQYHVYPGLEKRIFEQLKCFNYVTGSLKERHIAAWEISIHALNKYSNEMKRMNF